MKSLFYNGVENLDEALNRARSGAEFLDQRLGPDWDRKIDLDRLDIQCPFNCVLSQLMRRGHLLLLFVDFAAGVNYGFSCGMVDAIFLIPVPSVDRSFQRLTEAWKLVIRERRGEEQPHVEKAQTSDAKRATPRAPVSQAV